MRLISFSVSNFRSITGAHKIAIKDSTVLIGKNNEGKSNLLRALSIAMKALTAHAGDPIRVESRDNQRYLWRRDFPISLQGRARGTESVFRLEFSLDDDEVIEFRDEIKSGLNGTLPIEIKFGKTNAADIHVPKRGPGGNALSAKSNKIARYIADRIEFNYIPAIRTEDEALSVVQEMLSTELAELEENGEYIAALQKITDLQQPILERVSESIKNSLADFLPNVKNVSVRIPQSARRTALRNQCRVEIDDGSPTLLEYKGDGVKSLAALGLLKDKKKPNGASVIAIEEPESHLHPGAMHGLRDVIEKLSKNNQVVITTHCPLFVDRSSVGSNILIDSNSAKSAKDIASIRRLLGIRASDNLVNASNVLVVEGDEDVIALGPILAAESPIIAKALKQHNLIIEPIGGAGNLSYKLTLLSNALCVAHVLLDNDDAGTKAYKKAEDEKTIKLADVTFVNCKGMPASELEDCFERAVYEQRVLEEFDVDLTDTAFRGNAKWSDRAKACFEKQGKLWNTRVEAQLKAVVAEVVAKNPANSLNLHKRNSIDALVKSLEKKLGLPE
ncbi:ATP-dependent nuclease [Burkholderia cenocepacia]|uniref:ATP-dependent nuclease n=1 Tax=Burkholderia cenocepacia TaxID=95486 RepID=UPI0026524DB2|nr:AAA family ATPase [Burkholderia cenocepacia]MDN7458180.1 AAA family ATPase [Burkholderia cenocepacia]